MKNRNEDNEVNNRKQRFEQVFVVHVLQAVEKAP